MANEQNLRPIKNSSKIDDIIFDGFGGTGKTAVKVS